MKFQVGDKVQIKPNSRYTSGIHAGKIGTIVDVWKTNSHPYYIDLGDGTCMWFHGNELELYNPLAITHSRAG